jgi:MFS family permease
MKFNKVIVCLLGISVILNAAIAIVGPFFPPEAEAKGIDIKDIGYIFSAYPMAFVVVSLLTPTILHYVNQRAVFVISAIVYALSVAGFGSIIFMDKNMMLIMGIVFRVLQGSSNAAIYTTTYSIFSAEYEGKDFMKANSIFKGTIGGGLLLGLLIGTVLYIIGGYFLPFLVYSIVMLCVVPFGARLIPSKPAVSESMTNQTDNPNADDIEIQVGKDGDSAKVTASSTEIAAGTSHKVKNINPFKIVWRLLKNRIILKCLILAVIDLMLLNFSPAILSRRLADMNVSERLYGMFFALPFIFPIVSGVIVVKLMGKVDNDILL